MKASTSRRILVWVGGCWAAFALMMLVAGDADAGDALRPLLVVGATIGGIFYLGYRFRILPRRQSFQGQARDLGLRPELGDPLGLLQMPFSLFRRMTEAHEIENTASGSWRGIGVVVADYWFAKGGKYTDYERYTCVLAPVQATWPNLSVVPERIASRLKGVIGLGDIEMESEQFNHLFEVRAADQLFASAFVDARMMQWLMSQAAGCGFEILDGRLLLHRPRVTTSTDDVARTLELLDALLDHVPRVVADGRYPMAGA